MFLVWQRIYCVGTRYLLILISNNIIKGIFELKAVGSGVFEYIIDYI